MEGETSANDAVFDEATTSQIREIIEAALQHDLSKLQRVIDETHFEECKAVDVQDPVTGYTPLHAAIVGCPKSSNDQQSEQDAEFDVNRAYDTVRLLLENGAIWNQVDRNDETPGCIACRLGLDALYQQMVDAGVRAEILLNRLDEYDELEGDDENDEAESEIAKADVDGGDAETSGNKNVKDPENAAATGTKQGPTANRYLSSTLSMSGNQILDEAKNGVMMSWENDIMLKSASALLRSPGLKVLNIGFGMGIIDSHMQASDNRPSQHHIIEAHPEVLKSMTDQGWPSKSGVTVHEGRWQEVLPKLLEEGMMFDAVYYDTFAESYKDFKDFFMEYLLTLLEQDGTWSYFNGMGADRQISYDVYQKIVELDLFEAGFEVEWHDLSLPDLSREWSGVKRKYWNIDHYRLPVCKFMD